MDAVTKFLRRAFPRRARAALYGAGIAAVLALIASGELPGWIAPIVGPLLLAILNLSPADVEDDGTDEEP